MNKYVGAVLVFLLSVSIASFGRNEETLEQLIARADAAKPDQQPDLYMHVADRELKLAIEAYKGNQWEQFRVVLQQIVKYSDSAHSAAIHSNKHIKHTEIKIRQIATRLRDIKLNVDVDDQPQVQATIDRLEDFRTELLRSMFGAKKQ